MAQSLLVESGGGRTGGGGGRHSASAPRRARRVPPRLIPYLLLAPGLAVIAALMLYPMYQLVVMSFQKVTLRQIRGAPAESVGLENFERILDNELFWTSLRNTMAFAAVAVGFTLVLGTLVGLLAHRLSRWMSTAVVLASMLAWATPQATSAVLWKWLFDEHSGLINRMLGWETYSWLVDPLPVYTVLTICVVWQSFPFITVSVLAGLKSIPAELHEAARVDGAGPWRTFWRITFPLLKPIFAVLLVLSIIWDFKVFTQLHYLVGTGNRDVFNLSLYSYSEAFSSPPAMGLGSAIAVVLTVVLLMITFVYVRQIVRQEGPR